MGSVLAVTGMAVPYYEDAEYSNGRKYVIAGAFSESIAAGQVECLIDHDAGKRVASQAAGTLKLYEFEFGLHFTATITDPDWSRVIEHAQAGRRINGVSAKWRVRRTEQPVGNTIALEKARLIEISLMLSKTPRFPQTWAHASWRESTTPPESRM